MIVSRVVLAASGLMFLGFGLAFMFRPVATAGMVGISLPEPAAVTEIRAFYGGLEVGLAALLFVAAAYGPWRAMGLALATAAFAGPALGRIVGLVLDGKPRSVIYTILAVELAGAAVAAVCLVLETRTAADGG